MAVNIISTPMIRPDSVYNPVSTVNYPIYSSWLLSLTDIYDDFHYDINLVDENGLVNKFQVIAVDNDLFGNLSVNNYVDSLQVVDINSMIEDSESTPNHTKTYQLEIIPFNNGIEQTSLSGVTDTFSLMKGYKDSDILFTNNNLFINHSPKKLTTDSYFTNKSFRGLFNPSSANYFIKFDKIQFKLYKKNGDYCVFNIPVTISYVSLGYDDLNNADKMIIEFPVGPKNIMLKDRYIERYEDPNGVLLSANTYISIPIEDGDYYTYQTLDDRIPVSDIYTIQVIDCTNRFEPTTILFNNDMYGFDAFTFYDKKQYIIKNKQETYLSDNHERVSSYYLKTPADQDINIYKDDVEEIIILTSGWLNKQEINELEQLWVATKIRYQDGDELVPIIFDKIEKEVYNEKDRGLKKYTVAFKKANKKYFV